MSITATATQPQLNKKWLPFEEVTALLQKLHSRQATARKLGQYQRESKFRALKLKAEELQQEERIANAWNCSAVVNNDDREVCLSQRAWLTARNALNNHMLEVRGVL